MTKKLFVQLLVFLAVLPVVLADSIGERFSTFVGGFKGIGSPGFNEEALVTGFLAILPVIGLFFVVFGLMFYLSKITIFRGDDTDRYARWLAVGIGIIGIVQQSVFNTILSMSTVFLTLGFIVAIVFMFLVFVNKQQTSHFDTLSETNQARKSYLQSKGDVKKEKREFNKLLHEMGLDEKLYHKTERDLSKLEHDLDLMSNLGADELKAVDHLADLLRKATAAAQRNEQNQVHAYVQALSRDIGGLITKLSHDRVDTKKAHEVLNELRKHLAYAFKDEKDALTEEKHLEKILKRHLHHVHNFDELSDKDKAEALTKKIMREGTSLHGKLLGVRNAAKNLRALEDRIEQHMEQLAKYGYESKQSAASAVRDAVLTQDFAEAHKQLDHLRGLIEHGRQQVGDIHRLEQEMLSHVSEIESNERAMTHLIHDMKNNVIKEWRTELKSKSEQERENVKAAEDLLHHLEEAQSNVKSFQGGSLEFVHRLNTGAVALGGGNKNQGQLTHLTTPILSELKSILRENLLGTLIHDLEKIIKEKGSIDKIKPRIKQELENLKERYTKLHDDLHDVSKLTIFNDSQNQLSKQQFEAAFSLLEIITSRIQTSINEL